MLHGGLLLLAAVGLCVGFLASVMYLVQARRLRAKMPPGQGLRLLSLERLEAMNRRAVDLAFPLLTGGMVVGIVLMFQQPLPPAGPTRASWQPASSGWPSPSSCPPLRLAPARPAVALLTIVAFVCCWFCLSSTPPGGEAPP